MEALRHAQPAAAGPDASQRDLDDPDIALGSQEGELGPAMDWSDASSDASM